MSLHDPAMTAPVSGHPIGDGTIQCLRLWSSCPDQTPDQTLYQLSLHFGPQARRLHRVLAPFVRTLAQYGRRTLWRNAPEAQCRGTDEAALAHLVVAAATQRREDAMLTAITLVRPDLAPVLVAQAEALGLTLHCLHVPARRATHAAPATRLN